MIRGTNDDELVALLEFGRGVNAEVRFIEYMDVGGATRWSPAAVVPRAEMLEVIGRHYGGVIPIDERASAPAERFLLPDGTTFGIIASTTAPFCGSCDRAASPPTASGCCASMPPAGTDLRRPLRAGATPRGAAAADSRRVVAARRSRRRGTPRHGPADDADPAPRAEEGRAPRDAHPRGMSASVRWQVVF